MAAVPYRFERSATAADLRASYGGLVAGEETGVEVTLAGRLMLRREQGKLAFGQLRDPSGGIQLFCGAAWTAEFDGFKKLSLGDWIGVVGEVVATRTGELSVKVAGWQLLAEAQR